MIQNDCTEVALIISLVTMFVQIHKKMISPFTFYEAAASQVKKNLVNGAENEYKWLELPSGEVENIEKRLEDLFHVDI